MQGWNVPIRLLICFVYSMYKKGLEFRRTFASKATKMAAVDPSYPLYPIACILSAAMLLLVLLTSFIRQSWNLGVAFLCFWLFFENSSSGINAIVWSDNADIRLYVYCDIVSHLQIIAAIVKPMATLIITRRLYSITSLQSVDRLDKVARRKNLAIEWTLGLVIPVLVAGPLYYVVQQLRFEVDEGFGCDNSRDGSILDILFIQSWAVILPLVSVTLYYPRVIRTLYRQRRDINHFLPRHNSAARTNHIRILVLASIDVILTLPIGIVTIILGVTSQLSTGAGLPFYRGWTYDHTDWEPESFSYQSIAAEGRFVLAQNYFALWTSPVLAFAIFGLFGATGEARASYWRAICTICGWFGWKLTPPAPQAQSPQPNAKLNKRPIDLEIGSQPSYSSDGELEAVKLRSILDAEVKEGSRYVTSNATTSSEEMDRDTAESLRGV
ncbi:STE3-domain-containing protein [Peniophora sp. CONT]|nr:STE3-domain-containing protein [Peniophora sp. CONT]